MRRLIDTAELTEEERRRARGYLTSRVGLDTIGLETLSMDARAGIYRAAVRLAGVDQEIADPERALLERLREGLELDARMAREIEDAIPGPT